MESTLNTITKNKLISKGDVIGVGVSGGKDSMALLHYLTELKSKINFDIVVINIDHCIRENSSQDSDFVINYCKSHNIKSYRIKINVPKFAKENGTSIETAARDARYNTFESLIKKEIVGKVAVAHHMSDQAETVLLNIFRGCGLQGMCGMQVKRENIIRPFLETSKREIDKYISDNQIPFVVDESNEDNTYQRNYIRNEIVPKIEKVWKNFVPNVNTLAKTCKEDDDYIKSQVISGGLIFENKTARIPLSNFLFHSAVVSRTIFKALDLIGINKDIERKHIEMIKKLAKSGQNGNRISLPINVTVYKEYDYITITNKTPEKKVGSWLFKYGTFSVEDFGSISVKLYKSEDEFSPSVHIIDAAKLPKEAKWRYRNEGDIITKFGGGTKQLKSYLIEKKIPQRMRDLIPVLAYENEVFIVAGVDISDNVKIDSTTKKAYTISYKM